MRITSSMLNKSGHYQRVFTDDADESRTYLDSPGFAAYSVQVKKVIDKLGNPCIGEIKREMPDNEHRFLMDAIESLCSVGAIKCTREITPMRWATDTPRKVTRRGGWNNDGALNFKKTISPDAATIYGPEY